MHLRREGHKHIVNDSAVGCTPKEGNLNPYMTRTGLPVTGHAVTRGIMLTHLFSNRWVMSSQYHLIMMSSGIRFVMGPVDGTSVWFSLVLAWGAMSWKAIRSIKRSTGMAGAAMASSSLCTETRRKIGGARGGDRLSRLLLDRVPPWNPARDICPEQTRISTRVRFVLSVLSTSQVGIDESRHWKWTNGNGWQMRGNRKPFAKLIPTPLALDCQSAWSHICGCWGRSPLRLRVYINCKKHSPLSSYRWETSVTMDTDRCIRHSAFWVILFHVSIQVQSIPR